MAEFSDRPLYQGSLDLTERLSDGVLVVTFQPTAEALQEVGHDLERPPSVTLAEINPVAESLRIYPVVTLPIPDLFLKPKYPKIKCIQVPLEWTPGDVDDFVYLLGDLPRGLIRDPQYGLGVAKAYRVIIETIEELTDCTEIVISSMESTHIDDSRFVLSLDDFEGQRSELDRITNRGQAAAMRVRKASTHNWLAPVSGVEPVPINRGRHPMVQLLTDRAAGTYVLTDAEQDKLVDATLEASAALARRRPEALMKLASDIELVTIEVLIERFRAAIDARKAEPFWQAFFVENPFALHLAFGAPVVLVQAQASVGGRRLSGGGDRLADFLVKNAVTGNLAIFEIKRPDSKLVDERPYRSGLHSPSKELTGAISQVLDQRHQLAQALPTLKANSREWTLEAYAVRCCVVTGRMPTDEDQAKSFELFRGNSRNVEVVTYDELLVKLVQLRDLLSSASQATAAG